MVCLAGGPGANARYLEDLGGLAAHHELIIPDPRGTGASDPAEPDQYGFDHHAVDLELLRAHLNLESMTLLAHSAACTTAILYASRHPNRIKRLVLVAPSSWLHNRVEDATRAILDLRQHEPWYGEVVSARGEMSMASSPEEMQALLTRQAPAYCARWTSRERDHAASMAPANWQATVGFWRTDIDGSETRERLGRVDAPVLVVTGALDTATGVNAGIAWASCFPTGAHITIEQAGHIPWVDEPGRFRAVVADFLAA